MTAFTDAGSAENYTNTRPPINSWALLETFHDFNLSDASGTITRRLNSAPLAGLSGTIGKASSLPSEGILPRLLGFDPAGGTWESDWVAYGAYDDMPVHLAEIYADYTPQRLEISDSGVSPYETSARAFQVITNWTDAQIDGVLLKGEHSALSGKYLWWFNAANEPSLVGQFQ